MKFGATTLGLATGGIALAGLVLAFVAATPVQDAGKPKPAAQDAGGMGDMSGMMPNEHHTKLAAMVGKWKLVVKFRMSAEMPEMSNTGTSEIKAIMGGRFVLENATGAPTPGMGAFEGMGLSGYDNGTGKYQSTWCDNMGTAIYSYWGEDDPTTGHVLWHGEAPNMTTGGMDAIRSTMKKVSDDQWLAESFQTTAGKEWKNMEIAYTRAR